MEPATTQKCFAKAVFFLHTVSDEFTCDPSDDDEIPLSMLRLFKDLFSCKYENLPGIDSQIQTCLPSADLDLPVRECPPPYTSSDSDTSDSELTSTESQPPPSLDRTQACIQ